MLVSNKSNKRSHLESESDVAKGKRSGGQTARPAISRHQSDALIAVRSKRTNRFGRELTVFEVAKTANLSAPLVRKIERGSSPETHMRTIDSIGTAIGAKPPEEITILLGHLIDNVLTDVAEVAPYFLKALYRYMGEGKFAEAFINAEMRVLGESDSEVAQAISEGKNLTDARIRIVRDAFTGLSLDLDARTVTVVPGLWANELILALEPLEQQEIRSLLTFPLVLLCENKDLQ